MKFAIYTLGCKVNQYETQAMETELRRRGHTLVPFEERADAYIINTCAVTAVSGHKSRQIIRRAQKQNPAALVAVCGCYAQTDPDAVAGLGVDLVGGSDRRMAFLDELEKLWHEKSAAPGIRSGAAPCPPGTDDTPPCSGPAVDPCSEKISAGGTPEKILSGDAPSPQKVMSTKTAVGASEGVFAPEITGFDPKTPGAEMQVGPICTRVLTGNIMSTREYENLPAGGLSTRTRAMLKVEDGCVNFCSYCIIPYARGPVRSLPLPDAVAETRRLAAEGYREIVLTGIEISSWGQDLRRAKPAGPQGLPPEQASGRGVEGSEAPKSSQVIEPQGLTELVEAICLAAPDCRIRLGSLEPRTVTEAFCRRLSALPNLCPHFHLSLQSGCDATLKRMNRKYDTARYYESVALLRQWFANPGITTDLIVGFPGEDEAEFGETLRFIEKCGFSAMHIFPYSRRPGTPADKMPGQLTRAVKEDRARRAAALAEKMEEQYLQGLVGQELAVLFEEPVPAAEAGGKALWRGHAPNYVEVWCESGEDLHNAVRAVPITAAGAGRLTGTLSAS